MGLSNAASRARNYTRTVNQNQGGGDKKAGSPRNISMNSAWDQIYLHNTAQRMSVLQKTVFPFVRQSRPIGTRPSVTTYWHVPGTGN